MHQTLSLTSSFQVMRNFLIEKNMKIALTFKVKVKYHRIIIILFIIIIIIIIITEIFRVA